jgi:hypothetical protein
MSTGISAKLTTVAIALLMNAIIIVGVAFLFDAHNRQVSNVISLNQMTMLETV